MKHLARLILTLLISHLSISAQIDVDRTIAIGRNAIHFQDYIVSLGYFNQVISLRPWMAEPYFYRAVAKISLDDYLGAEEDASLALERNPIFPRAYLLRGIARFNLREYRKASEDFLKGLKLSPKDQNLLYNLSISLLEDKQLDGAERTARELLSLDSKNKDAYRVLAQITLERKDTVATQLVIDTLLSLDAHYRPALLLQAQIASEQKNYPQALQTIDQIIAQGASDANLYVNRAILRYHQKDLRGAMNDYSEALRLDPNERVALNNRALLRSQVGEYRLAIQDWSKLLQRDSNLYIARYNRALLYLRTNEYHAALKDLNVVLNRYPAFASGFSARAEVRQRLGDLKGATRDQIHLYDLQTSKRYRDQMNANNARQAQNSTQTRSEKDEAIEKYHMLIETDALPRNERSQYSSLIRGRVQDDQAQRTPRGDLLLTYFTDIDKDGNQAQVYFSPLLERFNLRQSQLGGLRLTLKEAGGALTQQEVQQVQKHLSTLEGQATSVDNLFFKGVSTFLLQDLDQSNLLLSQVIEQKPDFALAHFVRASVLLRINEVNPTHSSKQPQITPLSELNETIRLAPDFAQAYYNRANLYAKAGALSQARLDYNQALSLNKHFAEAYFNRGLLSYSEGKIKEGTSDLSRAGELGLYQAYGLIKRMNN